MARGSDFADNLTHQQRETLAVLRARVGRSATAPHRWRTPVGVAGAVLLVLLAVSWFLLRPVADEPEITAEHRTASAMLTALAQAAARDTDPVPEKAIVHRRGLSLVIVDCMATTTATESRIGAIERSEPAAGRLVVEVVAPPSHLVAPQGCAALSTAAPYPKMLFDGETDDEAGEWDRLRAANPGYRLPAATNTRQLGGFLGMAATWRELPPSAGDLHLRLEKMCAGFPAFDCAALRWTVLAEIAVGAETIGAQRAAALRTAAQEAGAVVTAVNTDVTGRAGVTLRVPQLWLGADGLAGPAVTVIAELTFDLVSGRLLQRKVYAPNHIEITVILTATRV